MSSLYTLLSFALATLLLLTSFPPLASATILNPPSCERWHGAPTYRKCHLALDKFVHAVTVTRGYSLDERIEFRSPNTVPKHLDLPSELLVPELYTFMGGDVGAGGELEGRICVIHFGMGYPRTRRGDASFVSSYGELNASAYSIIETCVKPFSGMGGEATISSEEEEEEDIDIGSSVSNVLGDRLTDRSKMHVRTSLDYQGERKLRGNPWIAGGPDPFQGPGEGVGDEGKDVGMEKGETMPVQKAYCDASREESCWTGFRCGVVRMLDAAKMVVWGLEKGTVADFVGSCVLEGGVS